MKRSEKILKYAIGVLFLLLYMLVATISAICSIDFFNLSHNQSMSICLAIAFELGAMCSLCAGVFMKSNRTLSFGLFTLLTLFQMMGNVFHSYTNLTNDFINWVELFGLTELELISQKRVVAVVSGAVLPIVALGFIKCFVDYNDKPNDALEEESNIAETESNSENNNLNNTNIKETTKSVSNNDNIAKNQYIVSNESDNESSIVPKRTKAKKQEITTNQVEEHKSVDLDPSTLI